MQFAVPLIGLAELAACAYHVNVVLTGEAQVDRYYGGALACVECAVGVVTLVGVCKYELIRWSGNFMAFLAGLHLFCLFVVMPVSFIFVKGTDATIIAGRVLGSVLGCAFDTYFAFVLWSYINIRERAWETGPVQQEPAMRQNLNATEFPPTA